MNPEPDLTTAITTEIACSIRTLGGNPETLDLTDAWQVNRTLGFLGADIYLMATVGSWQDTLTDQEVLDDLLTWNAGQSLAPDISFAAPISGARARLPRLFGAVGPE
jgi:hypothetical protein